MEKLIALSSETVWLVEEGAVCETTYRNYLELKKPMLADKTRHMRLCTSSSLPIFWVPLCS